MHFVFTIGGAVWSTSVSWGKGGRREIQENPLQQVIRGVIPNYQLKPLLPAAL